MSGSMPGRWGAYRERCTAAPIAPAGRLVGGGALVVLAPHPDDETFGASALIAEAAKTDRTIGIVAITDGDASHPRSVAVPRSALAQIRIGEQERAVAALGARNVRWLRLGLPDGGAGRDPRFSGAADAIARFCEEIGATALAAPHPDDPHPDHHAAGELARLVRERRPGLRVLFHPIWSIRLGDDAPYGNEDLLPFRVPVDVAAKREAIACHASQLGAVIDDDPAGFTLPDWFLKAQDAPFEIHAWARMPGAVPPASHFESLYAGEADPWHVRTSRYEADKRRDNCAQLAGRRYRRGLELGCGEGHLSAELVAAGLADAMLGVDRDAHIVERARAAHSGTGGLSFAVGSLPDALPDGHFDLVVISEVLYFLDEEHLSRLVEAIADRLPPGGDVFLVGYLGQTHTPLDGQAALDLFVALFGRTLRPVSRRDRENYRAELLRRVSPDAAAPEDDAPTR